MKILIFQNSIYITKKPNIRIPSRKKAKIQCSITNRNDINTKVKSKLNQAKRETIRLGIPSKGRMAEDTLQLLKECQLSVYKPNPRQYVAKIPQIGGMETWFQRVTDIVRKLAYGDIDLGIVGYDMFSELAGDNKDLVMVHDALGFGKCHLSLGIPLTGDFSSIENIKDLKMMGWTEKNPLRVVTGYHNLARNYFSKIGLNNVLLLGGDGALEAGPAMGSADIILDLVSTGVTLRENNLKEIEGGTVLESEGVLIGNKNALLNRPGLLKITKELIERFDAHLKANQYYSVIANMKGEHPDEIAHKIMKCKSLTGLQGPTISPVYSNRNEKIYAAVVCVQKKYLYEAMKEFRKIGGSGVLVQPMTYIFDEEPVRWSQLLKNLGYKSDPIFD